MEQATMSSQRKPEYQKSICLIGGCVLIHGGPGRRRGASMIFEVKLRQISRRCDLGGRRFGDLREGDDDTMPIGLRAGHPLPNSAATGTAYMINF